MKKILSILFLLTCFTQPLRGNPSSVKVGMERLLSPEYQHLVKNKRIGLITNQTGVLSNLQTNIDYLYSRQKSHHFQLAALFAPEHGINGAQHASEEVVEAKYRKIPVYSLHGKTRRPTKEMLSRIDVLVFDIQDIGSRSYTFVNTLFYAMEEAKKAGIPVIVTDRPNPINGRVVDGPMLENKWRSFLGYVNVPYCHGMTVGELARFFNKEYQVGCELYVIPMQGWKREMTFQDTRLPWVPTSPNIPEPTTTFYYPITGIIGELQLVNIGIGFTMPFKVVGAPWINGEQLAEKLNGQKLPGIKFHPFCYKPYYGKYAKEECSGVLITVTDPETFLPVQTQYMLIGMMKSLYPKKFEAALQQCEKNLDLFHKVNGSEIPYHILKSQRYPGWALREVHQQERGKFKQLRTKYLIPSYS